MALGTVLLTGWVENAVSVQGWRWAWPRPGETLRSVSGATGRPRTACTPRHETMPDRYAGAPRESNDTAR